MSPSAYCGQGSSTEHQKLSTIASRVNSGNICTLISIIRFIERAFEADFDRDMGSDPNFQSEFENLRLPHPPLDVDAGALMLRLVQVGGVVDASPSGRVALGSVGWVLDLHPHQSQGTRPWALSGEAGPACCVPPTAVNLVHGDEARHVKVWAIWTHSGRNYQALPLRASSQRAGDHRLCTPLLLEAYLTLRTPGLRKQALNNRPHTPDQG